MVEKSLSKRQSGLNACNLYRAINGSPAENLTKVIELLGGIQKIFGSDDIVVIKPNVQWWGHGAPNLSAFKRFVDLIMNRPGGFHGEVVLAENCHRGSSPLDSEHSGWNRTFSRNSNLDNISNFNDLSHLLQQEYGRRFSVCHWIDVASGGRQVSHPSDGEGYIYCDGSNGVPLISFDNGLSGEDYRSVIMSYPVFRTDKGTLVDFKNGTWENGGYTEQNLKFINFAALNHHSTYCGATSAIKNYLGIVDLSGGPDPHEDGKLTGNYYNFHSFPFNKWSPGPEPGMIGAEVAVFMDTIRKADINITTAEWVGFASRTKPPVARTKAVLACEDPVALDYHATKYILYPNSGLDIHNPDADKGPLHQYLEMSAGMGAGIYDESKVNVISYDVNTGKFQSADKLSVSGDTHWGLNMRCILKYLSIRYGFGG